MSCATLELTRELQRRQQPVFNPMVNAVSALVDKWTGGSKATYALSKEKRLALRERARKVLAGTHTPSGDDRAKRKPINDRNNRRRLFIDGEYMGMSSDAGFSPTPRRTEALTDWTHPKLAAIRNERREQYAPVDRKVARIRRGFVYIITHPHYPGMVKVGRTSDPVRRLASANTWCPTDSFALFDAVYFDDAVYAEKRAHVLLSGARLDGEWFATTTTAVLAMLNSLQQRK